MTFHKAVLSLAVLLLATAPLALAQGTYKKSERIAVAAEESRQSSRARRRTGTRTCSRTLRFGSLHGAWRWNFGQRQLQMPKLWDRWWRNSARSMERKNMERKT